MAYWDKWQNFLEEKTVQKRLTFCLLLVFVVTTFFLAINRVPCPDEAHSWLISKCFSFFELLNIEKYDGHLFVWHTLQMPFSKNNFFYPQSILILNWAVCMGAIYVLWRFSPFSFIIKAFITFSYPFFWYYPLVARCYTIGLLFFFILLSLFKKRLEHPIAFSILLIALANTSAVATAGATPLGLIFIYDLLKKGKEKPMVLIMPFLTLTLGAFVVLYQIHGAGFPEVSSKLNIDFIFWLRRFVFEIPNDKFFTQTTYLVFRLATCVLFVVSLPYFLMKSKRAFFFYISSFALLFILFQFIYHGYWWHFFMFYVYFLAAIWISKVSDDAPKFARGASFGNLFKNLELIFNTGVLIFLFLYVLQTLNFKNTLPPFLYKSKTLAQVNFIKENHLFDGIERVYTLEHYSSLSLGIIPYFPDLEFFDPFGDKKYNMDSIKNINNRSFDETNIDKIALVIDKTKKNLLLSVSSLDEKLQGLDFEIILKEKSHDFLNGVYAYDILDVRKVDKQARWRERRQQKLEYERALEKYGDE